jgi:hypothetical protein
MRLLGAIAALGLAQAALAAEGELSAWAGASYLSGSYGGPGTTELISVPITARYETGPWILRASVPYLRIKGTGSVVVPGVGRVDGTSNGGSALGLGDPLGLGVLGGGGSGGTPASAGTPASTRTTQTSASGLGDASASATYTIYGAGNRSGIGFTGKVKLPTGDETLGLGTGSTDVSAQIDLFRRIDATTLFGGIGYTVFGESPVARLENVPNVSLGLIQRLGADDSVGLALDLRQAGSPAPAAQRELSAFWIHRVDRRWRMQAYLLKGFADGSPDWGTGLSAGYVF